VSMLKHIVSLKCVLL